MKSKKSKFYLVGKAANISYLYLEITDRFYAKHFHDNYFKFLGVAVIISALIARQSCIYNWSLAWSIVW